MSCGQSATSRDRAPGPNATCCWARSRSSPLRSCRSPLRGVDGRAIVRPFAETADVDFALRMSDDPEPGAAQHRLRAGAVGNPPVGRIVGVALLDEMQLGKGRRLEQLRLPER